MATPGVDDGAEDVADFLKRIKELGDTRQQEDEERTRKLEEEILQGRKERQARRAERARSISPTKDSPLNSSILSLQNTPGTPVKPGSPHSPSLRREENGNGLRAGGDSSEITATDFPSLEASKQNSQRNSASLSRSGTLSWQQRPTSTDSTSSKPRGLSIVARENALRSPRATPDPVSLEEKELTMSEKAQALAKKDPSWFKQTEDRGVGSAAFRKNQDSAETPNSSVRLPGLSRETSLEPMNSEKGRERSSRSPSPSHQSPSRALPSSYSSSSQSNVARSPLPTLSSQRFEPPSSAYGGSSTTNSETAAVRAPLMSPSQGRISPERMDRPVSPTKGLGGFVQSAMMKRSDSVSKRWSQQAAPGLKRGNSVTGRGAGAGNNEVGRERSPNSPSRPGSRDKDSAERELGAVKDGGSTKSSLPDSASKNPDGPSIKSPTPKDAIPTSPSRTMDQKRWSPTKASWLEAAINKSEPPKPKPAAPQQPSWMAEINKAKQARGSVDLGKTAELSKSTPRHEVSVGGFLRSPPIGATGQISSPGLASKPWSKPSPYTSSKSLDKDMKAGPSSAEPSKVTDKNISATPTSPRGSAANTGDQDSASNAANTSPSSKAKPETPPKKDFRASLKTRQPSSGANGANEPEFKNVFGKLRKAETKNYVPPDELKDNILRGKTGLNVTGGPRVFKKQDEFKDSILKKKEEMKAAPSVAEKPKFGSIKKVDAPVPEAIAKRQGMTVRLDDESNLRPKDSARSSKAEGPAIGGYGLKKAVTSSPESPKPDRPITKTTAPPRLQSTTSAPETKASGNFNSALAGMLARGPPPMAATKKGSSVSQTSATSEGANSSAPALTHTTKSRARGPKRRAPTAAKVEDSRTSTAAQTPNLDGTREHETPGAAPQAVSTTSFSDVPKSGNIGAPSSLADIITGTGKPQPSPKPSISRDWGRKNPAPSPQSENTLSSSPPSKASFATSSSKPQPPAKRTLSPDLLRKEPAPSPKETETALSSNSTSLPPSTKPKQMSVKGQSGEGSGFAVGLGIASLATTAATSDSLSPATSPKPTPAIGKKPEGLGRVLSRDSPAPSPGRTQVTSPAATDAHKLISDFFDDGLTSSQGKINVDTQAALKNSQNAEGKIKKLRKEIWEITGDGKKISVPAQQEHILFEDCMYLCTHVFGSPSGKRMTEVYLWHGDGVSPSAVEDAQLFCRNAARDAGGRLTVVPQGKEPSNFFEALGGIVITRRGSAEKASSTYMLCGRRHMGQIAFDEVPFSAKSLCGGFPHIIATTGGNLYLWKGKGSSADELGCARLIAMDVGLTGEIQEVDEGSEPANFWREVFKSAEEPPPRAVHWVTKAPLGDKFRTRLFEIDADARPKSGSSFIDRWARRGSAAPPDAETEAEIREISPYALADLSTQGVFVLDSFFELFVIVGPAASSKLTSFRAALFFAQEYGILAASMEDRPFVPVGSVVFLSALSTSPTSTSTLTPQLPAGLRHAFRKWDEKKLLPFVMAAAAAGKQKVGPSGGEGDGIVGLNEALQAVAT